MKVEKIINEIIKKYYETGYIVKEICIPREWLSEWRESFGGKINPDIYENDYGKVLIFPTKSRHLHIIVEGSESK